MSVSPEQRRIKEAKKTREAQLKELARRVKSSLARAKKLDQQGRKLAATAGPSKAKLRMAKTQLQATRIQAKINLDIQKFQSLKHQYEEAMRSAEYWKSEYNNLRSQPLF